jgi:hypothetical protein
MNNPLGSSEKGIVVLTDVLLESLPDAKSFACLRRCILFFSAVVLMAVSICGCAPASKRLIEANHDFKEQHEWHAKFEAGSRVQAEYLGSKDDSYIYRVTDLENRNIYISISLYGDSILTLKNPSPDEDSKGSATFYFGESGGPMPVSYHESEELWLKYNSIWGRNKDIVFENNDYPKEVYFTMGSRSYPKDKSLIYYYYMSRSEYFLQNEKFSNRTVENLGMATSDFVLLELRNLGYIFTFPIDIVCSSIYSPIYILSWPVQGWAIN